MRLALNHNNTSHHTTTVAASTNAQRNPLGRRPTQSSYDIDTTGNLIRQNKHYYKCELGKEMNNLVKEYVDYTVNTA